MGKKKLVTTIALPEKEFRLLEELSSAKGLSKANLVAHALRVLGALEGRLRDGSKVYVEDHEKNKAELVIL